jgi:hypothetical protein
MGKEHSMKLLLAIIFLLASFSVRAQTVATTANVLHPIMKDIHKPNGPTSLDRNSGENADAQSPAPSARPSQLPSTAPAKPAVIIAHIDASLAASKISLIGTVSGLKGRLYVTNISSQVVTPKAQFAVCDAKGFKIGATTITGPALAPNEAEKIEVLATNLSAVDLKLMKLTGGSGN